MNHTCSKYILNGTNLFWKCLLDYLHLALQNSLCNITSPKIGNWKNRTRGVLTDHCNYIFFIHSRPKYLIFTKKYILLLNSISMIVINNNIQICKSNNINAKLFSFFSIRHSLQLALNCTKLVCCCPSWCVFGLIFLCDEFSRFSHPTLIIIIFMKILISILLIAAHKTEREMEGKKKREKIKHLQLLNYIAGYLFLLFNFFFSSKTCRVFNGSISYGFCSPQTLLDLRSTNNFSRFPLFLVFIYLLLDVNYSSVK